MASSIYSPEPARSSLDYHSHRPHFSRSGSISGSTASLPSDEDDNMPPTPGTNDVLTRASRSTSSASRTNRLSLTLPISLPTADPSRPPPTAGYYSPAGTPSSAGHVSSPSDTNEFIIAIAAQERRVLELKEELSRAETDLAALKRQWANHEAYRKRDTRPFTPITPIDDDASSRLSLELDRRKLLLNLQRSPKEGKRKVFRGGHTRTLSLLSPSKPEPDYSLLDGPIEDHGFLASATQSPIARSHTLHQAQNFYSANSVSSNGSNGFGSSGSSSSSSSSRNTGYASAASSVSSSVSLSKRTSWQSRASYPSTNVGMSQIVEDLKLGFRTFYDDIRQITVGDEPITGRRPNGSYIYNASGGLDHISSATIATRAHGAGKPHPYDPDSVRAAAAAARARNSTIGLAASAVADGTSINTGPASGLAAAATAAATSAATAAATAAAAAATAAAAAAATESATASMATKTATPQDDRADTTTKLEHQQPQQCEQYTKQQQQQQQDATEKQSSSAATTSASPTAGAARRRWGEGGSGSSGATAKQKHFSWTPLSFDALNDSDWSNWESPATSKPTRWSGSTMGDSDAISSVDGESRTSV
ncbi:hypothetical protein TD95_003456 [Thielaviopsis punctulata]|uniref:DUF4048 domain-containing protein n=1 Tax=Thielaviopsis punctulata TaxID=72032 RepID=A0A0F4ZGB9_9PEZI|nr:hypothetical protein TD95_003456 [Thielaviopsis punctulata]